VLKLRASLAHKRQRSLAGLHRGPQPLDACQRRERLAHIALGRQVVAQDPSHAGAIQAGSRRP